VPDIFDEVEEDLRAERNRRLLRRYGGVAVLAAVLTVAAVGGWQVWRWNSVRQARVVAADFIVAADQAAAVPPSGTSPARQAAIDGFAKVAQGGHEGYRTLARFREAALKQDAGDKKGAAELWDQVAADTDADPLLRDLANLLWADHQLDEGDSAAVAARLAPLAQQTNPWHPLAQEAQALLALRLGHTDEARTTLRNLQQDSMATDAVRQRASGLLARLGS
jgi:hypothetical protein